MSAQDAWNAGEAYESYMGRWSRPLARRFVEWLAPAAGARWADVGCGTGALTAAICESCAPASVVGCDPSAPFIAHARRVVADPRARFAVAAAEELPDDVTALDYAVAGLALNFLPDPAHAVGAISRRLRGGGTIAAYVWDYAEGIGFLRRFWDEAVALDAAAAGLDEGRRFSICRPDPLRALFAGAGLRDVTLVSLEISTTFRDFDDLWTPFLRGTGPTPAYVTSLTEDGRARLRERLAARLPAEADGSIALTARAWAVRGSVA